MPWPLNRSTAGARGPPAPVHACSRLSATIMNVPVKGADLFYTARGQGSATCLVLSSIGTRPYERQIPAALDASLRMVFVDLRGSGRSTGEPTNLTFDVLAEDLDAVRQHLGVARVAVLGHSILGVPAIEYARRRPDSVSHVIAVGTPPTGDMARLLAAGKPFFEQDASEQRKRILHDNMAALPPGASPAQMLLAQTPMRFFDPRFDAAPLFAGAEAKPAMLAHLMGTLVRGWDFITATPPLRTPLLLAHGRYDYTVPYTMWQGITETLPDVRFRLFERSGHQPFVEEPEDFVELLMGWMGIKGGDAP
jgi:proline iminopeptidase